MHYLLYYEVEDDYVERRAEYRAEVRIEEVELGGDGDEGGGAK